MTSQEWMQLGYPVFVASTLEQHNTDWAEEECDPDRLMQPARFALLSVEDQMDFALSYEGIIGYTSSIVEAVTKLNQLKGGKPNGVSHQ